MKASTWLSGDDESITQALEALGLEGDDDTVDEIREKLSYDVIQTVNGKPFLTFNNNRLAIEVIGTKGPPCRFWLDSRPARKERVEPPKEGE